MKERNCPDCEIAMQPIQIIDRSHVLGGAADGKLTYAAPDEKRDFFLGVIYAKGTVEAILCPDCGRVLMYANPGGKP